jgi:hypothetical protein
MPITTVYIPFLSNQIHKAAQENKHRTIVLQGTMFQAQEGCRTETQRLMLETDKITLKTQIYKCFSSFDLRDHSRHTERAYAENSHSNKRK